MSEQSLQSQITQLFQILRRHQHDNGETQRLTTVVLLKLASIGLYASQEYDNGSVSSSATIDWSKGNVQYVTLTGNTTFTFTNPLSGMRCILHVAGAYTPTFPGTVRYSGGTTPTATATSGHKDIYTFIYSAKEALYDTLQSPNYAIT